MRYGALAGGIALLTGISAPAGARGETHNLDRACAERFGEGFAGRVERATGGPICARVEGVSIRYERLEAGALCATGRPEVIGEGAEYRCTTDEATSATLPAEPTKGSVLRPTKPIERLRNGQAGDGKASPVEAIGRPGSGSAKTTEDRALLRPLPAEQMAADDADPPSPDRSLEGRETEAAAEPVATPEQVDLSGIAAPRLENLTHDLQEGGSSAPTNAPLFTLERHGEANGPGIDPELEAMIAAAMGAGWRDGIAGGVMPGLDYDNELNSLGVSYPKLVVRPCQRPNNALPELAGPFEVHADLPNRMPETLGDTPITTPTPRTQYAVMRQLANDAHLLSLSREKIGEEAAWVHYWSLHATPHQLVQAAGSVLALCLGRSSGVPDAVRDTIRQFLARADIGAVPSLESYVVTMNEIAATAELCDDIHRYRLANRDWVASCAPLHADVQDEVLTHLPFLPPELAPLVRSGTLSQPLPAAPAQMAEDNGAGPDTDL
ncbi:MAG: hypothetical protein AAF416_21435 [Pseudomonadota bacterium]